MPWAKKQSERLQVNVQMKIDRKRFKTAKAAYRAAVAAKDLFIRTGRELNGVHIVVRWRNPDNWNPRHFEWKTSDDEDQSLQGAYETLGQRGAFEAWRRRPVPEPEERDKRKRKKRPKVKRTRSTTLKQHWRKVKNLMRRHPEMTLGEARKAAKK